MAQTELNIDLQLFIGGKPTGWHSEFHKPSAVDIVDPTPEWMIKVQILAGYTPCPSSTLLLVGSTISRAQLKGQFVVCQNSC